MKANLYRDVENVLWEILSVVEHALTRDSQPLNLEISLS